MKNIFKYGALIIAFLWFAPTAIAQGDFISAKDFAKIIKDKNTVVISAQKLKNYNVSHITGSVHIDHHDLTKDSGPKGVLISTSALASYFGKKGVSNTNTIVIYDDGNNKYSSRIYWVLKYLGAQNVKLLHKDMKEWRAARIPITKNPTKISPKTFTVKKNPDIYVSTDWVKANLNKSNVIFVDARSPEEFDGSDGKSKGHLPGAVNIEWKKLIKENGALKSKEELKKIFTSAGVTPDKIVVLYCATSLRAGIEFVALKSILAYPNVKVYDGAYNEWEAKGNKLEK